MTHTVKWQLKLTSTTSSIVVDSLKWRYLSLSPKCTVTYTKNEMYFQLTISLEVEVRLKRIFILNDNRTSVARNFVKTPRTHIRWLLCVRAIDFTLVLLYESIYSTSRSWTLVILDFCFVSINITRIYARSNDEWDEMCCEKFLFF